MYKNKRLSVTIFLIIFIMLSVNIVNAEEEIVVEWQKTYGKELLDTASDFTRTIGGGYLIIGTHRDNYQSPNKIIWLIKISEDGTMIWNQTYIGNSDSMGYGISQTSDLGYILVAEQTETKGPDDWPPDLWLIKTDSIGNIEWNKTYGGDDIDECYRVIQTNDAGYLAVGGSCSYAIGGRDGWILKTDSNGEELWNKSFGGLSYDVFSEVKQLIDSSILLAGTSITDNKKDFWFIKTDKNGNISWEKTYDKGHDETLNSFIQTIDAGYLLIGKRIEYYGDDSDAYIIKTDSEGNEIWNQTYGGSKSEGFTTADITSDGGYIFTGYTFTNSNGSMDLWVVKTDEEGNKQWEKTVGGEDMDSGGKILQTDDEGYIITGYTKSYGAGNEDIWVLKLNKNSTINNEPDKPEKNGKEKSKGIPGFLLTTVIIAIAILIFINKKKKIS